jgi:hypothetical protein
MGFGGLLEGRKSKSEDLPGDRRQTWKSRGSKRKRKTRTEHEEENAKRNEKGKAATEKRHELSRFG